MSRSVFFWTAGAANPNGSIAHESQNTRRDDKTAFLGLHDNMLCCCYVSQQQQQYCTVTERVTVRTYCNRSGYSVVEDCNRGGYSE